jgi:hypothetical protein
MTATNLLLKSMNAANAVLVSFNQFQLDIVLRQLVMHFRWFNGPKIGVYALDQNDAERIKIAEGCRAFLDFF